MRLSEIMLNGFTGVAPTILEKSVIKKYLVANDLFNILEFVNIGLGSNIGNLQATILTYERPANAEFRGIGEEYEVSNEVPTPITIVLKMLGGEFQTDRTHIKAFSTVPGARDNWTETQIKAKIDAIINGFANYFIKGNSKTNPKQFDGLQVFFNDNQEQVEEPFDLDGGLTASNAMDVERYFNKAIAKVVDAPNVIITTRMKGKPLLQAIEQYRNRGITTINVGMREYHSFMGLPIIALDESCFPAEMTEKGIPFVLANFSEYNGIRVAVPMNVGNTHGTVLDVVKPNMGKDAGGESVFVKKGGVELMCAPIIKDPYCASLCYINEVVIP